MYINTLYTLYSLNNILYYTNVFKYIFCSHTAFEIVVYKRALIKQ